MFGPHAALTTIFSAIFATAGFAKPGSGERYYLVIYGAQAAPFQIRSTHTWATMVKTAPSSDGSLSIHADTISWMPATLRIRPLSLRAEPGINLTAEETLDWIHAAGARVSMLGPYEIDRENYERLLARKDELESGAVAYRAIGGLTRNAPVSNCGQSFTRADPVVGRRYWQPTPAPGERGATRLAARYVRAGSFMQPHVTHDWLLPDLGIERASVVHRQAGVSVRH